VIVNHELLKLLLEHGRLTIGELSGYLLMNGPRLKRLLGAHYKAGYVTKVPLSEPLEYTLTSKGYAVVKGES